MEFDLVRNKTKRDLISFGDIFFRQLAKFPKTFPNNVLQKLACKQTINAVSTFGPSQVAHSPMMKDVKFVEGNGALPGIDFADPNREPENWNFSLLCLHTIVKMAALTIVLTSSDDYTTLVGFVGSFWPGFLIGVLPLFGGFASFPWDWINSNVGYKRTSVIMCFTGIIGALMYAFAGYASSPGLLICGRIIMGIASSSNIVFHYISIAVGKKKKALYSGKISASVYFGFALGPLLAALVFFIFGNWDPNDQTVSPVFNVLTFGGWAAAVGYTILIILYVFVFQDTPLCDFERYKVFVREDLEVATSPEKETETIVMTLLLLISTLGSTGTSAIETRSAFVATASPGQDASGFGWSWSQATASLYVSLLFMFLAFLCILTVLYRRRASSGERYWLLACHGVIPTFSTLLLFNYSVPSTGSIVLWTIGSISFAGSLAVAKGFLFSVVIKLAPRKNMGFWTSALGLSNSIGRCLGPTIATSIGNGNLEADWFSGTFLFTFSFCTVLLAILFRKLTTRT